MSSNTATPRRSLARPRPSLGNGNISTVSSPNLSAAYNALQSSGGSRSNAIPRKSSLSALTLTQGSLAKIPDASRGYGLSTVLDEGSPTTPKMPPFTPSRQDGDDLEVGDIVDVPGNMYGTVKFIGTVQGKKGIFAGVELSEDFAIRGKNSGDVDG
jgi:hypothetical protein